MALIYLGTAGQAMAGQDLAQGGCSCAINVLGVPLHWK